MQKQIQAYSRGDDSEETRATIQKLSVDLQEAQEDLEETERQKYIRDQQEILDDFMDTLQDWVEGRMNNIDSLISEAIRATNDNGKTIDDTINESAEEVNYRMTDEFANIWNNYSAADGLAASQLDILTLTNEVTNSVREKMNELPTEVRMEEFFDEETVKLLESLTTVDSNILNTIEAISTTNEGIDNVNSNIVEFSGYMGEKLDTQYNSLEELKMQLSFIEADIVEFSGNMGEKLDTEYNSLEELKQQLSEVEARIVEFSGDMGARLDNGNSILDNIQAVLDTVRVEIAEFSGDLGQRIDNGNNLLDNLNELVEDVDRDVIEFSGELGERIDSGIDALSDGADGIQAEIEEWSGYLGNKIDRVTDAINGLDLNVEVNVDASTGSSDVETSGGDSGESNVDTNVTTDTTKQTKQTSDYSHYKVTGYDDRGYAVDVDFGQDYYSAQEYYDNLRQKGGSVKLVPYAKGGIIGRDKSFLDAIAQLLGEDHMVAAKEGERILTEEQNKNFEKMVNANFTPLDDNLKSKYSIDKMIEGLSHMSTPNVGNMSNVGNTTTVGDINITLPNVTNKEEFVSWLKNDGQISKIIQSLTIGQMMGKNSYNKMKY